MTEQTPRTGISVVRNVETAAWWSWAETDEERDRAPAFLRPILAGEVKRVRASRGQIDEALRWAEQVPGWRTQGPSPLHVFDPDAP